MSYIADRIKQIAEAMEQMLSAPFPLETAPPDTDDFSHSNFQTGLVNNPVRLVHVITSAYYDTERDEHLENERKGKDADTLFGEYAVEQKDIYDSCVTELTKIYGKGTVLDANDVYYAPLGLSKPSRPDIRDVTPAILFNYDCILFSLYKFEITYWIIEDRVAFMQYTGDHGDGDFQFAVSACVVKNVPEGPAE